MATILFVDDDPAFAASYGNRLERRGHTVLYSLNAEDAIERVTHAKLINRELDLVVLDIDLPVKSIRRLLATHQANIDRDVTAAQIDVGVSTYDTLHRQFPRLNIITYSAWPESYVRKSAGRLLDDVEFYQKNDPQDGLFRALCRILGPPPQVEG